MIVLDCLLYTFVFLPVFGWIFSVHYLSSLLSRSVCDRRLMFSVSAWKLITVLTSVCLSWQSRCLYLALSIMHSICTFISCFVSFSHMLSQALSFCLSPQYLSDGHSIRSHHRNLLALRKLMANLITVATWKATLTLCASFKQERWERGHGMKWDYK